MHIGLACGGTGGHIFPGLASGEELRRRGHEVTLWLADKDIEEEATQDWPGAKITVSAEGFPNLFRLASIRAAGKLYGAYRICKKKMSEDRPDLFLAMGSYAMVGPVMAALRLKVPVVLHEANVVPGRAISLFSRWADIVAASFEETRYYLKRKHMVVTGMPLRKELEERIASVRREDDAAETARKKRFTILVMGGSRGASRLNEVVCVAAGEAYKRGRSFHVIHLTGVRDEEDVKAHYVRHDISHEVYSFVHDMASNYIKTDLIVCRSGASTCSEIGAFRIPALLVPYPYAAHNHQVHNARALEKRGVADMVLEENFSADWLADYISGCLENPARLTRMREAARNDTPCKASVTLANVVEECVGIKED